MDGIEAAYVKPPAEPAHVTEPPAKPVQFRLNEMAPAAEEPPAVTPDFTSRQDYLERAPVGIAANYAWTRPGGRGAGVNIIDIEWGWRFNHEDLIQNQGGIVSGIGSTDLGFENHGTAVIGEFSGDRNTFGITGISPAASVSAVSLVTNLTSQAIRIAADRLRSGDIILLEVHRGGPRATFSGQFGFIAIEWWPDDFAAIRYAVSKGVIVVEAGGNGGQNLDDPVYDTPQAGFPPSWRNPFNPANPRSGAVVVGAGNPPAGTHGRNAHPGWGELYADRARCFFSNYGARVDAQGWGWEVTSTAYGDLQGGPNRDLWYTDLFSGTSSASPIVVGALACVQGVLRHRDRRPLTPRRAQNLLRSTGSPQQDGPGFTFTPNMSGSGYPQNHPARPATERIGNRPNLRQLLDRVDDDE
jgi:Subtilase family